MVSLLWLSVPSSTTSSLGFLCRLIVSTSTPSRSYSRVRLCFSASEILGLHCWSTDSGNLCRTWREIPLDPFVFFEKILMRFFVASLCIHLSTALLPYMFSYNEEVDCLCSVWTLSSSGTAGHGDQLWKNGNIRQLEGPLLTFPFECNSAPHLATF